MSKVLFVNPFFLKDSVLEQDWMMPYFPLGLLYLAAVAREAGHTVQVFDGTFQPATAAFQAHLEHFQPEVVCIASLITWRPVALDLGKLAQASGAQVLYGGPDPTLEAAHYAVNGAVVVIGEGEITLVELLTALANGQNLTTVNGIAYHDGQNLVQTAPRESLWNLDQLPLPARDLIEPAPYFAAWEQAHGYRSITLAVSRGCPYQCEHCQKTAIGPHFRLRSLPHIIAEMQWLEQHLPVDRFRLVDDLEGIGEAWLVELGTAMQAAGITTPYEGLRQVPFAELPLFAPRSALCGKRNQWLPPASNHPHAAPSLSAETLWQRWREGKLVAAR
jgi:radical SAM superfamily enzyme YgiQ (UPF0313 family)